MSRIIVDASELNRVALELGRVPGRAVPEAEQVVSKGALNIKNQLQADASGHPTYPAFPASIGYDLDYGIGRIGAEIGPDKDATQGALGNLLYFGSSNNAPVLDLEAPLRAEGPRYEKAAADMLERLLT